MTPKNSDIPRFLYRKRYYKSPDRRGLMFVRHVLNVESWSIKSTIARRHSYKIYFIKLYGTVPRSSV